MRDKFLEIIKLKLNSGYVWGAQGNILTRKSFENYINKFGTKHYYFNGYSALKWLNKEVFDCSGLIVYALQQLGLINNDYTAAGLYKLCKQITIYDLQPGDFVFNKKFSHVGIYIGDNKVIHARSTYHGVVETNLFKSFVNFGRYFNGDDKMTVKEFQEYAGLVVDGIIGKKTTSKLLEIAENYFKLKNAIKIIKDVE